MSQFPRYESYKDSGVQWLGEIPSHWAITSLKFECDVRDGTHETPEYVIHNNNTYPLITSKDLVSGSISFENIKFISEDDFTQISKRSKVDFGDLLMPMIGTVGGAVVVETNRQFAIKNIALFKPTKLYSGWLKYILDSEIVKVQFDLQKTGGVQAFVSLGTIRNLEIFKVPIDEQKVIANFLDKQLAKIDALIAKQETLLKKLEEQRIALISHAVTKGLDPNVEMKDSGIEWLGEVPKHWSVIKNKFIFNFSKGLTITKANLVDEGIPCVSYGEVHSKFGFEINPDKHELKCVPEIYLESDQNSLLQYGNFIFADTSEDIKGSGNFTYLNSDRPTFAGYHTVVAKMNQNNNPRFMAYIFDTEEHRNQVRALVKGVKVFSITQTILKNTFSWVPSIKEQNKIVSYLDAEVKKYQKIGEIYQVVINRLKEYRSTLITQAVTGKIDVRNIDVN